MQENPVYARALSRVQTSKGAVLPPALVAVVLHPAATLSATERAGLEQLSQKQEHTRIEYYHAFSSHWSRLHEQHFSIQMREFLE